MTDWDAIRARIKGWKQESAQMKSYVRSLFTIIDKAEEWGIDHTSLEKVSDSNLKDITSAAKRMIQSDDKAGLGKIFQQASELTNAELVRQFRSSRWERVCVREISIDGKEFYRMDVTEAQFERIRNATSRALVFEIDE